MSTASLTGFLPAPIDTFVRSDSAFRGFAGLLGSRSKQSTVVHIIADSNAAWREFLVRIAEKVEVCWSAYTNHGWYNSVLRLPHTRHEERERKGRTPMTAIQEYQTERRCPWCNGSEIQLVQRGYTGPTDEVNQYYTCRACGKVTYELIAKTAREMRLGRYHAGGIYKDSVHQTRYSVSRVLKVGLNEYLIYLKPLPGSETFPVASINP